MLNVQGIFKSVAEPLKALIQASANASEITAAGRDQSAQANLIALQIGVILWSVGVRDKASYDTVARYSDWRNINKDQRKLISQRMSRVKAIWKHVAGRKYFAEHADGWLKDGISPEECTEVYGFIRAKITGEKLYAQYTRMKYLDPKQAEAFYNLFAKNENLTKRLEKVA